MLKLSHLSRGFLFLRQNCTNTKQNRLANLGSSVESLVGCTPGLLHKNIPQELIHKNIKLVLLPEVLNVEVAGHGTYNVTMKLLQLMVRTLLVPPNSELQVLGTNLTKNDDLSDATLCVHWRSSAPETEATSVDGRSIVPGRLLHMLQLTPSEYPILAGTFEYSFDGECERVLVHKISNLEYMARPVANISSVS